MKTTKAQFEFFKKQCRIWIERFGLGDWEITFNLWKLNERLAETRLHSGNRKAQIVLSSSLEEIDAREEQLKRTACHEVLHIVLGEMSAEMFDYFSERYADKLEHIAIMHLLKGFGFEPYDRIG